MTHRPDKSPSANNGFLGPAEHEHYGRGSSSALLPDCVDAAPGAEQLVALAEKIQGLRERRDVFFGGTLISETGWQMLIALVQSDAACHCMTVSNICRASHAPATTALRWLERLVEFGLVRRDHSPSDARVVFVQLEPRAKAAIYAYLSEIWTMLYGSIKIG